MSNNEYMYAIDRSDEYLAHYGIKGMKWGVRKAIESGNSRALARQYKKASRKLAKLQARANNGKKYARRAAALGAGAAALGGAAAAGTEGVGRFIRGAGRAARDVSTGVGAATRRVGEAMTRAGIRGGGRVANAGNAIAKYGVKGSAAVTKAGFGLQNWGKGTGATLGNAASKELSSKAASAYKAAAQNAKLPGRMGDLAAKQSLATAQGLSQKAAAARTPISNNTLARIGAGAAAAGLAGAAGYNAYRAATTKKAAAKAAQFQKEMNQAFKGTQYANGGQKSGNKKRRRK